MTIWGVTVGIMAKCLMYVPELLRTSGHAAWISFGARGGSFEKHLQTSCQQVQEDGRLTVAVTSGDNRAGLSGPRRKQILRAIQQVEDSGVGEVRFEVASES